MPDTREGDLGTTPVTSRSNGSPCKPGESPFWDETSLLMAAARALVQEASRARSCGCPQAVRGSRS